MLGLKCIQNISIMAEPHNSLHSVGKKDILSAALGQSGLLFTQRVEDDVQDVFAALAEDAKYPPENNSQNLKFGPTAGKPAANESFDNDLDDLMDLISNDTGPFVQSKQENAWPSVDFSVSTQISSNFQQKPVQSTSSNFKLDSILNHLKCDLAPQVSSTRPLLSNSNTIKTEATPFFPTSLSANSFGTGRMPGFKSVIGEQRYGFCFHFILFSTLSFNDSTPMFWLLYRFRGRSLKEVNC